MTKHVVPQPDTGDSRESAGQALTRAILADTEMLDLDLDATELELLTLAATAADRIAELEAVVAEQGTTFVSKAGVTFPSPLLAEIRLQNAVLMRAMRGIKLDVQTTPAGKNLAKSRAGLASWAARSAKYGIKQVGSP